MSCIERRRSGSARTGQKAVQLPARLVQVDASRVINCEQTTDNPCPTIWHAARGAADEWVIHGRRNSWRVPFGRTRQKGNSMGDKGGKKDKEKSQQQLANKQKQKE